MFLQLGEELGESLWTNTLVHLIARPPHVADAQLVIRKTSVQDRFEISEQLHSLRGGVAEDDNAVPLLDPQRFGTHRGPKQDQKQKENREM